MDCRSRPITTQCLFFGNSFIEIEFTYHTIHLFKCTIQWFFFKYIQNLCDFPGRPVIGSPPANSGDVGLIPGLGGFHLPQDSWARVPQLLSPHSRAWEPHLPKPTSPSSVTREATTWEVRTPQLESSPSSLQLDNICMQQQRPSKANNNKVFF